MVTIVIFCVVVVNGDHCDNIFSDGVDKASNLDIRDMVIVDKHRN